jgi:nucleotide-binding universal stress UspA family protein
VGHEHPRDSRRHDFSESAEPAVRAARQNAQRDGARLHIVHAQWSAEPGSAQRLADLSASLGAGVPVVTAVLFGDPANEIVRYAREHDIDLIVVGTHGRTGLSRALLGSVAERVIRTASCPVLRRCRSARPGSKTSRLPRLLRRSPRAAWSARQPLQTSSASRAVRASVGRRSGASRPTSGPAGHPVDASSDRGAGHRGVLGGRTRRPGGRPLPPGAAAARVELIRALRIFGEFVRGFRAMHFIGPCVTVFGSARVGPDHVYYAGASSV